MAAASEGEEKETETHRATLSDTQRELSQALEGMTLAALLAHLRTIGVSEEQLATVAECGDPNRSQERAIALVLEVVSAERAARQRQGETGRDTEAERHNSRETAPVQPARAAGMAPPVQPAKGTSPRDGRPAESPPVETDREGHRGVPAESPPVQPANAPESQSEPGRDREMERNIVAGLDHRSALQMARERCDTAGGGWKSRTAEQKKQEIDACQQMIDGAIAAAAQRACIEQMGGTQWDAQSVAEQQRALRAAKAQIEERRQRAAEAAKNREREKQREKERQERMALTAEAQALCIEQMGQTQWDTHSDTERQTALRAMESEVKERRQRAAEEAKTAKREEAKRQREEAERAKREEAKRQREEAEEAKRAKKEEAKRQKEETERAKREEKRQKEEAEIAKREEARTQRETERKKKRDSETQRDTERPAQKKPKRDPRKPKAPMSAYLYYCVDARPQTTVSHPQLDPTERTKLMGQLWKQMSDADKQLYEQRASVDKARHASEMAQFNSPQARDERDREDAQAAAEAQRESERAAEIETQRETERAQKAAAAEAKKAAAAEAKTDREREKSEREQAKQQGPGGKRPSPGPKKQTEKQRAKPPTQKRSTAAAAKPKKRKAPPKPKAAPPSAGEDRGLQDGDTVEASVGVEGEEWAAQFRRHWDTETAQWSVRAQSGNTERERKTKWPLQTAVDNKRWGEDFVLQFWCV